VKVESIKEACTVWKVDTQRMIYPTNSMAQNSNQNLLREKEDDERLLP